jgi:hypothetical protein
VPDGAVVPSPSAVFDEFAAGIERRSPDTAAVLRHCGRDPLALELLHSKLTWDVPHRLLAAVRWLVLAGEVDDYGTAPNPWAAFAAVLHERGDWIARFIREQPVQTNEVQRCFALLPLFLTVARATSRPLDLLELGPSAGLNLLWDRYRYRYRAGTWGPERAGLELRGEERAQVPEGLLRQRVDVHRRRGIDLNPIDVGSDEDVRLLYAFASADDDVRLRLQRAVQLARDEPPELLRGNYLDLLPQLLAERDEATLTVVFQTHSTIYLPVEQRVGLRAIIDSAGESAPLAWISAPTPEEHGQRRGDYPLELALWPGGGRRIVARTDVRGDWLEWLG